MLDWIARDESELARKVECRARGAQGSAPNGLFRHVAQDELCLLECGGLEPASNQLARDFFFGIVNACAGVLQQSRDFGNERNTNAGYNVEFCNALSHCF